MPKKSNKWQSSTPPTTSRAPEESRFNYRILDKGKLIASFLHDSDRNLSLDAMREAYPDATLTPEDKV